MYDYTKYNGIKKVLVGYLKKVPKIILGAALYANIIKRKKDTHYLVLGNGIGDSLTALAYLKEYKRKNKIAHITAIGAPAYIRQLISFYPREVNDVIYLKKWQVSSINEFSRTSLGRYLITFPHRDIVTFTWICFVLPLRAIYLNETLSLALYAKAIVYQIDLDTKPEPPQIPNVDICDFISKYHVDKDKTVFFNIEANTVQLTVTKLFVELADYLIRKGFRVLTFTANDKQKPVEGSTAVPCTLEEAYRLAEYGGTLVGLRSGFLDFMVFSKCRLVCVDDPAYGAKEVFDLEKWGVNDDCHTVIYQDDETTLREIIKTLDLE